MLENLRMQVSTLLSQLDFGTFWPGFTQVPFALYDDERVLLESGMIPWDQRFLGNTAISWDDGFLAIWKPEDGATAEELTAGLVHEMFHAFQMKRGEMRFPQDLHALSYPENRENLSLKLEENRLLAESFGLPPEKQRTTLAEIASIRRMRQEILGDYFNYELLCETVEGMAEYVGMRTLFQISEPLYILKLEKYRARLQNGEFLFDPRRCSYYSGALLLLACGNCSLDFCHEVGKETRPVFDLIADRLPVVPATRPREDMSDRAKRFFDKKQVRIDAFFQRAELAGEGEFRICGYDPMNMERRGDHVLCSHFVMLEDPSGSRFIEGPVGLLLYAGSDDRVAAYYIKDKKAI
ncbi:MAG: hypothetical protein VB086_01550 [Clostridiaceae bacterium]|nr:hypothetical protein [Clostridiaceae bacterium]